MDGVVDDTDVVNLVILGNCAKGKAFTHSKIVGGDFDATNNNISNTFYPNVGYRSVAVRAVVVPDDESAELPPSTGP